MPELTARPGENGDVRMKPIIILPPDAVSDEDIKRLNDNDLCVVVAKDPSAVKFVDPIPSASQRTKVEDAAIQLSRKLLTRQAFMEHSSVNFGDVARIYVDAIISGTPLSIEPTQQEMDHGYYSEARAEEMRRLAREDARAERAKIKAEKEAQKKSAK